MEYPDEREDRGFQIRGLNSPKQREAKRDGKSWQESRRMSTFEWTASFAGGGRSEEKERKEGCRPRLAALIPLANAWRVEMSRVETSPVELGTQ